MVISTRQSWSIQRRGLRDRIAIFGNFNNSLFAGMLSYSYKIQPSHWKDIQKHARIISDFWNGHKWWF